MTNRRIQQWFKQQLILSDDLLLCTDLFRFVSDIMVTCVDFKMAFKLTKVIGTGTVQQAISLVL